MDEAKVLDYQQFSFFFHHRKTSDLFKFFFSFFFKSFNVTLWDSGRKSSARKGSLANGISKR